ncbi:MAG TPA: IS5 family transposase [Candidatus Dormibacteraeota bacterium]|nr:IS5 family transposase [Candidatus Dormibacteraeota bacterium]
MRSKDVQNAAMWSYISPEQRVPADHPLRPIREMANLALEKLSPEFTKIYSTFGRPSIPPERLLRALLLQVLYTIRSERMLMEQLEYNMLFRWFVGMNMDDTTWDVTVFTKNRERFLNGEISQKFFAAVLDQARAGGLLSDEHFTVDGTLIEAWASHKSFKPKDEEPPPTSGAGKNPDVDFKGTKRANDTHASTTDPDARLYRKSAGSEAKLGYLGHVLTENRHGLAVDTDLTFATGTAEREAALAMIGELPDGARVTLGGDKGYDTADFVAACRAMNVTPHVAQNTTNRRSAIDGRTTRHGGYGESQRKRKRIEEVFGWGKVVGTIRKVKVRGKKRVGAVFTFAIAAYNLTRMRTLLFSSA